MTPEASQPAARSLEYPFSSKPALGETLEVAPGVLWIRMTLPYTLNHINLWALEDGDGWAIVDTGVRDKETTDAWRKIFANGFGGRPVTRVFVTHMHPDHVGMAGWLVRRFSCRLWMTRAEYLTCRVLVADTGREAPTEGVSFYRRAGWTDDQLETYRTRFGSFGKSVYALPDNFRRLHDGEVLTIGERQWEVVIGNGHSPEHACLVCHESGLLISGDHVLPRISSNVSVFPTEPTQIPSVTGSPRSSAFGSEFHPMYWCCQPITNRSGACTSGSTTWSARTSSRSISWNRRLVAVPGRLMCLQRCSPARSTATMRNWFPWQPAKVSPI